MPKAKRLLMLVLALLMVFTLALTACSKDSKEEVVNKESNTSNKGNDDGDKTSDIPKEETLKILFKGPKPEGFDAVYDEYLKRTKDTLNIKLNFTWVEHADYKNKLNLEMTAGADYDIVFDAPWIHLKTLAADGYYADLSGYFNNDQYPGLKAAFSDTVMENNKWFGRMCYIPLYRTLGNGVPAVHYRLDWANEWGIGEIDSYEKLEQYWAKAKENNILPLSVTSNRGYFQLYTIAGYNIGANAAGISMYQVAGITYYVYTKDNKVVAIAAEGEGDEAFKDFPAPYNRDFGVDRFNKFAQWTQAGYISRDSMTITDANTPFYVGEAASKIGTLDDVESDLLQIPSYSKDAQIGYFIYSDECRNMQDGAFTTDYIGNNGLAIPESSKKKDDVMRFLDWLFASEENHDLFELGIEGVDYVLTSEDTYTRLTKYDFPGYGFTWNPNYVKFSDILPENVLKYRKWELNESAYASRPILGFTFNGTETDVATAVAQVKAITDKVNIVKLHGILSDGTKTYSSMAEMLKTNLDEAYASSAQFIEDELVRQINEYLAK